MKTENTPKKSFPSHLAVRKDESEITGWRQHSLRVFGDGSGQWKWSPPTEVSLAESEWLDEGQEVPAAYSVRKMMPCKTHSEYPNEDCKACIQPVSAPMLISKRGANTVPLMTPAEFYTATVRWRNRVKAAEMKAVRHSVPKDRSHGPVTLLTALVSKLQESRALLRKATKTKSVLQAQAFLDSALADAEAVSQKLKR